MRPVLRVLGKDARILRRSPLLLGVLLAYPLLIAALVALVAQYANAKPRVALVDRDGLPQAVEIGGRSFHVNRTIDRVSREVELVRLDPDEAERQLETGRVVAVVTVPPGFVSELRAMARSPRLELETTRGGLAPRVTQQVQALVYQLNRELQEAYIDTNLEYVRLILDGGTGDFGGQRFDVLGLRETDRLLDELPPGPRLDAIREFVGTAQLALGQTDEALRATANPIELVQAPERGRTWALSAQVQAYALAIVTTLLALLLAAGSLAAERDENVVGRLARGLVSLGQLVAAKAALAAVVSLLLGTAIAVAFGLAIELGNVEGGEPWSRVPLLALGLVLAGACVGALGALVGALAREARTASLVAVLVVLPIVFLGLVPREVAPAAGWLSDALPYSHAVRLFAAALYDVDPGRTVLVEAAWLAGLGLLFGAGARAAARRLLA
ncbi:MAG TPA: ABC transporter permease [Gaiellaceae bacterium]|nr:ABC transporter permease [Gaiellaceae bacterium]